MTTPSPADEGQPGHADLSGREAHVLRLIALGYSSKELAARLKLSVKTVETYKGRAMEKLGLRGRVGLIRHAIGAGWLLTADPDAVPGPGPAGSPSGRLGRPLRLPGRTDHARPRPARLLRPAARPPGRGRVLPVPGRRLPDHKAARRPDPVAPVCQGRPVGERGVEAGDPHRFGGGPQALVRRRPEGRLAVAEGVRGRRPVAGDDAGSAAAHRKACRAAGDALAAREWTAEEREARGELSKRLGLRPPDRWAKDGRAAEELALLGTMPDKSLAERLGRTWSSVRAARVRQRLPPFRG